MYGDLKGTAMDKNYYKYSENAGKWIVSLKGSGIFRSGCFNFSEIFRKTDNTGCAINLDLKKNSSWGILFAFKESSASKWN